MTNEEARAWLEHHFDPLPDGTKQSEAVSLAIKALEQKPCEDWHDVSSDEMTLEQARQAVKDLRKKLAEYLEQEPKWIPVSERLPEKYTYTLWCASSGYVRSDYFNGEFWEDAKKYCYEVIAWTPLPEPFKVSEIPTVSESEE